MRVGYSRAKRRQSFQKPPSRLTSVRRRGSADETTSHPTIPAWRQPTTMRKLGHKVRYDFVWANFIIYNESKWLTLADSPNTGLCIFGYVGRFRSRSCRQSKRVLCRPLNFRLTLTPYRKLTLNASLNLTLSQCFSNRGPRATNGPRQF